MQNNRPKIGIALSGASGRAVAHIAVLEVLREHSIPIDYIVGCSSGALIAASFVIGTMDIFVMSPRLPRRRDNRKSAHTMQG